MAARAGLDARALSAYTRGKTGRSACPHPDDIVIVSAARTPVGSFNGAFGSVPAHVLGTAALKAAMERAGLEPARWTR